MKTNPALDAFEEDIRLLKWEYDKYFVGANDLPPISQQESLQRAARDLRGRMQGSVDRFRLSSLEARLNSYVEMFNRRVRNIEEGRERRGGIKMDYGPPKMDPMTGINIGPQVSEAEAAALYAPLFEGASKKVGLDSFRAYLDQQASNLRQKAGCDQVSFRLAREGGRLKLKAKPVRQR